MTTYKEHTVRQTEAYGRLVWKTEGKSKIRFYASAENSIKGVAELHAAAAQAFALTGHDRVWVVDAFGTRFDVVSAASVQQVAV